MSRKPNVRKCSVLGCDRPHVAHGYCDTHYKQMLRNGEVKPIGPYRRAPEGSVRLPGLRISKRAAGVLERRGPTVYQAAQATIEEGTK